MADAAIESAVARGSSSEATSSGATPSRTPPTKKTLSFRSQPAVSSVSSHTVMAVTTAACAPSVHDAPMFASPLASASAVMRAHRPLDAPAVRAARSVGILRAAAPRDGRSRASASANFCRPIICGAAREYQTASTSSRGVPLQSVRLSETKKLQKSRVVELII